MENSGHEEICNFGLLVLDELQGGNAAVSDEDMPTLRHSINKLEIYSDIIHRMMEICTEVEMKATLSRLHSFVSQFLNANQMPNYSTELRRVAPAIGLAQPSPNSRRPAYVLPFGYIGECRKAGMSKAAIARHLGISRTTLYKHKYLIPEGEDISDDELTRIVAKLKVENPYCGEKFVKGHLRATSKNAAQKRVRAALRSVDPVGTCFRRRVKLKPRSYSNPEPMFVLHIDGNEKLKMYHIYIHGCTDGFSRKALYLRCATNKRSETLVDIFQKCTNEFGFPHKVRSDKGLETKKIAKLMLKNRGLDSYITGKSTNNTRIERLWGFVNDVTERYKLLLQDLEASGYLDTDNELHMLAVAYIYIPRIQQSLDSFSEYWNHHSLRTVKGDFKTPNALFLTADRSDIWLVDQEGIDDSESSDSEDENCKSYEEQFFEYAQSIVPNPLNEDGSNGTASLFVLLNSL